MRDIKFRGWYGEKIGMMSPQFNGNINEIFEEANGIYMQFTGLKDKNGVEIYEGDLLEDDDGKVLEVIFENGSFGIKESVSMNFYNKERYLKFYAIHQIYFNNMEVIGNVYENKELLEGLK